eukprot:806255-Amphidinium_carterae.1
MSVENAPVCSGRLPIAIPALQTSLQFFPTCARCWQRNFRAIRVKTTRLYQDMLHTYTVGNTSIKDLHGTLPLGTGQGSGSELTIMSCLCRPCL